MCGPFETACSTKWWQMLTPSRCLKGIQPAHEPVLSLARRQLGQQEPVFALRKHYDDNKWVRQPGGVRYRNCSGRPRGHELTAMVVVKVRGHWSGARGGVRYVVVNADSFAICGTVDDAHIVFRLDGRPVFSVPEADYLVLRQIKNGTGRGDGVCV